MKTRKGNVATEISIERKLETCDHFKPISTGVSPLALIKGMVSFSSAWLFTPSSSLLEFWKLELVGTSEKNLPSLFFIYWETEDQTRKGLPKATWPVFN